MGTRSDQVDAKEHCAFGFWKSSLVVGQDAPEV